jgi:hypothetical protein
MAALKTSSPTKRTVKQAAAKKASATTTPLSNAVTTKKPRVFAMSFASVYPLYVQKAEKKGRTKEEVNEIVAWLTGYSSEQLQRVIDDKVDELAKGKKLATILRR